MIFVFFSLIIPLLIFKQVPGLVTLKKLSCVSFAGVDSLDEVKNHTYNELFMSGGFVVSDESVLNPDSITTGKYDAFWSFKNTDKKRQNSEAMRKLSYSEMIL